MDFRTIAQADDFNPPSFCCLQVYVVETGRCGNDVPQSAGPGDECRADITSEPHHQDIAVGQSALELVILERTPLNTAQSGEHPLDLTVHGFGLCYDDLHFDSELVLSKPLSISAFAMRRSPGPSMLIERSHGIS